MPATVPTRGVLKASQNRVRTSLALQGNAMWENVIGVVNEQAGTNAGVEALINAPQHGGARKRSAAARAAAAEAVMATGGFDTAITSYESLLSLAKSQGAVGGGSTRGACKVCGQLGHLTKQCRNQFSKYYQPEAGEGGGAGPSGAGAPAQLAAGAGDGEGAEMSELSDTDLSSSDSDSSDEERRRRRKEKERKRKRKERKERKKAKKEKREKSSKHKSSKSKKKRRRHSSSGSGSSSDSD